MIAWIDEHPEAADSARLGGKGAGLAFLAAAGLRVPPAFVVTTEAFRRAVTEPLGARLDEAVAGLPGAGASEDELERACAEVRELILEGTADHPARAELREAYERLGHETPVAVRSSSTAEDSGEQSFAGGHDTHLWVSGADAVDRRLRECWASLYTTRAVAYRARGAAAPEAAMAVVVQEMVDSRAAGVFMTLDPANGDRSTIVVESLWGLGELLVSGEATPDRYVVDRITGGVRRELADKPGELVREPGSGQGTATREVEPERREQSSLAGEELDELVRMAKLVEERAGAPQDGEFAVAAGEPPENVYVLQCRPETVWSRRERRPVAGRRSALESVVERLSRTGGSR